MEFLPSTEDEFQGENLWGALDAVEDNYGYSSDYYFNSYAHFGIHEEMIKDTQRTVSYKNAIMRNPYLFKDKVVMDIGCGTGILSFFAAKAGAKHVYAIDCSDIIEYAQKIVEKNGFSDRITLIKGKVEEIELPVKHVDIIISEWMGYFLLYEGMFNSVMFARDKWLISGGMLFPDHARISVSAIQDAKYKYEKIDFWTDVYGINMQAMRAQSLAEPLVDLVDIDNCVSSFSPVFDCNLETVTEKELNFISTFKLHCPKKDMIHGIVAWFDVGFFHGHKQIVLSTSPKSDNTHWKQTIFYFDRVYPVEAGQIVEGSVAVRANPARPRELDIKISLNVLGGNEAHTWQFYRLR